MLELRKRYLELQQKATQLMLAGKMTEYIKALNEIEQMNLVLVRVNR